MNDTLIVGALLLVLLGAVAFYLYSRILFTERKMGLIESILLDIKMNMEMEDEQRHMVAAHVPAKPTIGAEIEAETQAEALETDEVDTEMYTAVLESVQEETAAMTTGEPVPTVESVPPPAYEESTRDELAAMAEKRGLRVTKRTGKSAIIALLQEADKRPSGQSVSSESDGPTGGSLQGMGGASDGAPLESVTLEELP
jgi:hypothetical protein